MIYMFKFVSDVDGYQCEFDLSHSVGRKGNISILYYPRITSNGLQMVFHVD